MRYEARATITTQSLQHSETWALQIGDIAPRARYLIVIQMKKAAHRRLHSQCLCAFSSLDDARMLGFQSVLGLDRQHLMVAERLPLVAEPVAVDVQHVVQAAVGPRDLSSG